MSIVDSFHCFIEKCREDILLEGDESVMPFLGERWNKIQSKHFGPFIFADLRIGKQSFWALLRHLVLAVKEFYRLIIFSKTTNYSGIEVFHRRVNISSSIQDPETIFISLNSEYKSSYKGTLYLGNLVSLISGLSKLLSSTHNTKWRVFDKLIRRIILSKLIYKNIVKVKTTTYYDWFNLSLVKFANENQIETIEKQHGILYPHPYYHNIGSSVFSPSKIEIWGSGWVNPDLITKNYQIKRSYNLKRLNSDQIKYDYLIIGGCRLDIIKWMLNETELNFKKIIYRPHPAENYKISCNYLENHNITISKKSLNEDLAKSKFILSVNSTVLLESAFYKKGAALIPLPGHEFMFSYGLKIFPHFTVLPRKKFFG